MHGEFGVVPYRGDEIIEHRLDQTLLLREVPIERGGRDAGPAGDLLKGDLRNWTLTTLGVLGGALGAVSPDRQLRLSGFDNPAERAG